MRHFIIKTHNTGKTIFEGQFETFKSCLEHAIKDHVDLQYADLRNTNLCQANLDDAAMPFARFDNANMMGANLSESIITHSSFNNATLYGACFAYADASHSVFAYTALGGLDITGCDLSACTFHGTDVLTLNLSRAKSITGCFYCSTGRPPLPFSTPPLVLHGLGAHPIAVFDELIYIKNQCFNLSTLKTIAQTEASHRQK